MGKGVSISPTVIFSYGDGIVLYSFLRHFKPRRIIEVGSGFSSAAMLDVNELFFAGSIALTFIEPDPARLFALFKSADEVNCTVIREPIQKVPLELFRGLSKGDILFVDSSHVVKIGSDVLHLIAHVLPALEKGVLVHFHDILWPFEYPQKWLVSGRAWNEVYFLRAFLQYNNSFEIVYFNSFMERHCAELLQEKMPLVMREPSSPLTPGNASLWLRKVG